MEDQNKLELDIEILLTFKGHSRLATAKKGHKGRDIKTLCRQIFEDSLRESELFIKFYSQEWETWIDVTENFSLEKKEKFLIEEQIESDQEEEETGADSKKLSQIVQNLKGALGKKELANQTERKQKAIIKVQIGWQHYNNQRKCYSQVKSQNGGGVVFAKFSRTATYQEVIQHATKLYFPNGESVKHGSVDDTNFKLGNQRGMPIKEEDFSLQTLHAEGGSRTKLYLLTRKKPIQLESGNSSSSSDDNCDLINPFLDTVFDNLPGPSGLSVMTKPNPGASGTPTVSFRDNNAQLINNTTSTPVPTQVNLLCTICTERVKDSFVVPCGHTLCVTCADKCKEDAGECPFCKGLIEKTGRLF